MTEPVKIITVAELEKHFGSFKAVKSISFHVNKGEIYGFLGANGAGKSTTIKMLCGLLEPDGGTAEVAGFNVGKNPEEVKKHIGYMCQKFSLYEELSVRENLYFFGGIYGLGKGKLKKRIAEVIDILSLSEVADTPSGSLPRGFQQRLALGCAMIHEPEIIFLDEPTAGVDPVQRRNFWNIINDLSVAGTTVFVTTHFLDEAEFCHRISFIVDGDIVADDTPAELKKMLKRNDKKYADTEPTLEDVFIYLATRGK
ncbi:MAG TPA: ABC transporter ATP-binding protein [bacterium]|nr:ABC transporter ATP-binding protein [bacterium]